VVSDGQSSIRKAVATSLPGVVHGLCHFHYLKEAAKPFSDADRHAKKELKKGVRGVRVIERATQGSHDPFYAVVQGYAQAVRSALSQDGRPPLATPGLDLQQRLSAIEASLEHLAQKGICPSHWNN
jgi:hypothetical protein